MRWTFFALSIWQPIFVFMSPFFLQMLILHVTHANARHIQVASYIVQGIF